MAMNNGNKNVLEKVILRIPISGLSLKSTEIFWHPEMDLALLTLTDKEWDILYLGPLNVKRASKTLSVIALGISTDS